MSTSATKLAAASLLGKIVEVCIVTPDYKRTIDGLTTLGIGPFQIFDFTAETVKDRQLRGKPGDFTLKVGFAKLGDLTFEIMQPVKGESIIAEYLDRSGGKEGIQHIAFDMGNTPMAERKARMGERGIEPAMEGKWIGKKGVCHFCFFDTEVATGTFLETIEFSPDWEDPLCQWYPAVPDV